MEGEDRQAWRVIQGYVSAHMHSRLAALEGAIEVEDAQLVLQTARDFVSFSELARRLNEVVSRVETDEIVSSPTHTMRSIVEGLEEQFSLQVRRQRRLPKVFGDAPRQSQLVAELLRVAAAPGLTARFRQRDQRLVMSLAPVSAEHEIIRALSRQSPLRYAVAHTSVDSVRALIISCELLSERVGLYVTRDTLHLSFGVVSQLMLPFTR